VRKPLCFRGWRNRNLNGILNLTVKDLKVNAGNKEVLRVKCLLICIYLFLCTAFSSGEVGVLYKLETDHYRPCLSFCDVI
jgi:hypothetical protein